MILALFRPSFLASLWVLALCLFTSVSEHVQAQSLGRFSIQALGGVGTAVGSGWSFSGGQVAAVALQASGLRLTQGFQQPESFATSINEALWAGATPFKASLWPNPAREFVSLGVLSPATGSVKVQFYTLLGQEVQVRAQATATANELLELDIPLGSLSSGIYLIQVEHIARQGGQRTRQAFRLSVVE
jgi:hypothetical protein